MPPLQLVLLAGASMLFVLRTAQDSVAGSLTMHMSLTFLSSFRWFYDYYTDDVTRILGHGAFGRVHFGLEKVASWSMNRVKTKRAGFEGSMWKRREWGGSYMLEKKGEKEEEPSSFQGASLRPSSAACVALALASVDYCTSNS